MPQVGFAAEETVPNEPSNQTISKEVSKETAPKEDTVPKETAADANKEATVETNDSNNTENEKVEHPQVKLVDYAPTNVKAWDSSDHDKIGIKWSGVKKASYYRVYMSTKSNGKFTLKAKVKGSSCKISGLTTGKRMYFKVESVIDQSAIASSLGIEADNLEVKNQSKVVSAVPMLEVPSAKTSLVTGTKSKVKWKKVKGASGYYIYGKSSGGKWKKIKTTSRAISSCTHSKLKKKRTQYYKVTAYRNVSGTKVKGKYSYTKIYVPKVLTKSSSSYKSTNQYRVIKTARKKLGCRYVFGASGPYRFDCSGFACWTMRHCGVSGAKFRRLSSQGIYNRYHRYSIGRRVSKAQPGDIILYGRGRSRRSVYHTAIYYGNRKVIHATTYRGRGKVKIGPYRSRNVVAIIRFPGLR